MSPVSPWCGKSDFGWKIEWESRFFPFPFSHNSFSKLHLRCTRVLRYLRRHEVEVTPRKWSPTHSGREARATRWHLHAGRRSVPAGESCIAGPLKLGACARAFEPQRSRGAAEQYAAATEGARASVAADAEARSRSWDGGASF